MVNIDYIEKIINNPKCIDLDLSNSGLNDQDMIKIVDLLNSHENHSIKRLNLDYNNIKDAGFISLAKLKKIQQINLDRNNITKRGLEEFLKVSKGSELLQISLNHNNLIELSCLRQLGRTNVEKNFLDLISNYKGNIIFDVSVGNRLSNETIQKITKIQQKSAYEMQPGEETVLIVSQTTKHEETITLEALDAFNDEFRKHCSLYKKPIKELNVQECILLYNIVNSFYILDLNKVFPQQCALDKTINRFLQEDYKLLFIYARAWHPVVAVVEQKRAILQKLLEYRAQIKFDINEFITEHNQTLLHLAVKYNVDDEITASLINAGANIYIEDQDGYTPFNSYTLTEDEIKHLPVLYQQEYDVHLPVPTSSLWNARLHLNKLFLKWQQVEFFKNEIPTFILQTLNPEQLAADLYVLVTITDDTHIALKEQQLKNLERELMTELNCKKVVIITKNNAFSHTIAWKDVLYFGEKQQTLLNEVKVIIKEHDLYVFDFSISELQNVPTLSFLEMLSPKQKLGFIKLGIKYFSIIGGRNYQEFDQDRVFTLLTENEKILVKQACYWNLHIICNYDDNEALLQIASSIMKAIDLKQVIFNINSINWYNVTCLDHVISKTSLDARTGNTIRKNGKICVLLLQNSAKATNNSISKFEIKNLKEGKPMYTDQSQLKMPDSLMTVPKNLTYQVIEQLPERALSVSEQSQYCSELWQLISSGQSKEVLSLIKKQRLQFAKDDLGNNILHIATLFENNELINRLLEKGTISIDETNKYNLAPIHIAAFMGNDRGC